MDWSKNIVMVTFEWYLFRAHKTILIRKMGSLRGPKGALKEVLECPKGSEIITF